jgi:hypothetical protein
VVEHVGGRHGGIRGVTWVELRAGELTSVSPDNVVVREGVPPRHQVFGGIELELLDRRGG